MFLSVANLFKTESILTLKSEYTLIRARPLRRSSPVWYYLASDSGDQSIIFQLRTQQLPLNQHLNRIGVKQTAACPLCDYPTETVEHHLFFCRKLTDLRGCFLPKVPHTANCLYSSKEQLERTCTYYRMASSRRALAHNATG